MLTLIERYPLIAFTYARSGTHALTCLSFALVIHHRRVHSGQGHNDH